MKLLKGNFKQIAEFEKESIKLVENYRGNDLTIIHPDQKSSAFDDIMKPLNNSNYFFVGNVGSLLDVVSGVNKIEIRKKSTAKGFSEEVEIALKSRK